MSGSTVIFLLKLAYLLIAGLLLVLGLLLVAFGPGTQVLGFVCLIAVGYLLLAGPMNDWGSFSPSAIDWRTVVRGRPGSRRR